MNHALHIHLSSIAGVPADRWRNNRSHHSRVNESAHPSYDKAGVPANKRWSRQSKSPYADRCMRTGKWRNIRSWKGSLEDFFYMYGLQDVDKIYKDKIKFYCPRFICTAGGDKVSLRTNLVSKEYPIEPLEAVSTIGAGDNFNAGLIYGLLKYDVRYRDLNNLNEEVWDKVVQCGKDFAAEVCRSFSNSVSVEFAGQYASK